MLEVRPGLLLGSMGDALAVFSHAPSIKKQYSVTHVLTLANDPPDWSPLNGDEGDGDGEEVVSEGVDGEEEGDSGASEGKGEKSGDGCKGIGGSRSGRGLIKTMFVRVADLPKSDLHHFEPCIKFIKEGVERCPVLVHVHWYAVTCCTNISHRHQGVVSAIHTILGLVTAVSRSQGHWKLSAAAAGSSVDTAEQQEGTGTPPNNT